MSALLERLLFAVAGRRGRPVGKTWFCLRPMLAALWVLAFVAALLLAGVANVGAKSLTGIIGDDDRKLLDSTVWPWHAIGRVNRTSGGFCTGTLVAPDLVLTARHCLVNPRTGRRVQPDMIHFLAGYRRGEWLRYEVGRAFIPAEPEYAQDSAAALAEDWVLVVLKNALDVKPVPVVALSQGKEAGARLARAGYARDRPHLLSLHDGCVLLDRNSNLLVHDCDATHGDSGSPLLVGKDDETFIIGMTTGASKLNGIDVGIAVDARAFVNRLR